MSAKVVPIQSAQGERPPATAKSLRHAMNDAVRAAETRRASADSCPSCEKKTALLSVVFRGIRVGRICRFCPFTSWVGVRKTEKEG